MDKILLFIPMYNCEKQIVRVLNQLKGDVISYFTEVILVNNQSTDHGERAVLDYLSEHNMPIQVKLLRNRDNYGLGGSHKVAFEYAKEKGFDYIVVLHGDDQGELNNLLPVLQKKIYKKYDCCLGARFIYGSKLQGYSKFRTLGNRLYNILFSVVLRKAIYDLGSGLNLYRVDIFEETFYHQFPDNLTFNCYMLFAAHCYHWKTLFFPIVWKEDDQVSNVKMVKQAFDTFAMALQYFCQGKKYLQKEFRAKCIESYSWDQITQNDSV